MPESMRKRFKKTYPEEVPMFQLHVPQTHMIVSSLDLKPTTGPFDWSSILQMHVHFFRVLL